MSDLRRAVDAVLDRVVTGSPGVPGVAAVATDREGVIYAGARGERTVGGDVEFTTDTVCHLYSTTKSIGGTACLQLVDDGLLDLDAPAREYVSAIGEVQVLDGFGDDGEPRLRQPVRDITTRQLLTHTAGFAYEAFNETYHRLVKDHGQPDVSAATWDSIKTPLLFDPGDRWEYGSSIDWAGMVVEGITGRRLGDVLAERVFEPLGMTSTAFAPTDEMLLRIARVHARSPSDGGLIPMTKLEPMADPELHMAGHGLYGSADDYTKFIRMWLNDGRGPGGEQILEPETVAMASRNNLPDGMTIKPLPAVNPRVTNEVEFFPGMAKTWALTFMVNETEAPTGRSAGSLSWAGLPNLYYWIDRHRGLGGFWATQIFPFMDPTSLDGFLTFETAVYDNVRQPG